MQYQGELFCCVNVIAFISLFSSRGIDAKSLLSSLAGSLMSNRGFVTTSENGASQVVALNLTNLFVLVLLKALIFAAGSLGAGAWKGGFGRSSDAEEKFLTDEEILLFASYLTGGLRMLGGDFFTDSSYCFRYTRKKWLFETSCLSRSTTSAKICNGGKCSSKNIKNVVFATRWLLRDCTQRVGECCQYRFVWKRLSKIQMWARWWSIEKSNVIFFI